MFRVVGLLLLFFGFVFASDARFEECKEKSYFEYKQDEESRLFVLNKIIEENPENVSCMIVLANMYFKRGDVNRAFDLLKRVQQISPEYIKDNKMSDLVNTANKMSSIKEYAKKMNDKGLWNILGESYFKMGIFSEAANAYKESLKIDKNQTNIRLMYSLALININQIYNAAQELKKIISQDGGNFFAYYYLGKLLAYDIDDKTKAALCFKKAENILNGLKESFDQGKFNYYKSDLAKEISQIPR